MYLQLAVVEKNVGVGMGLGEAKVMELIVVVMSLAGGPKLTCDSEPPPLRSYPSIFQPRHVQSEKGASLRHHRGRRIAR